MPPAFIFVIKNGCVISFWCWCITRCFGPPSSDDILHDTRRFLFHAPWTPSELEMTSFFPVAARGNSFDSSCVVHPTQTVSEKSICSIPPYSLAAVNIYLQSYNFAMVASTEVSVVLHEVWSRAEKDPRSKTCEKAQNISILFASY